MLLSAELINDNGISQVAIAFFTTLFGMVGWLIHSHYSEKKETRNARQAAEIAAESAQKAETNTRNVSNGFARNVLGKLQRIDEKVDNLADAHREHLQWHMEREQR